MVVADTSSTENQQSRTTEPVHNLEEIYIARDSERRRLSAEIHDGVVQWIIGALYHINACRDSMPSSTTTDLESELAGIASTMKRSIHELRRIISNLRPPLLEKLGLLRALHQAMTILDEDGVNCTFEVDGALPELTPQEERAVFGIVQEALTNIRKHARASDVRLCLKSRGTTVSVVVSDDGQGFVPEEVIDNEVWPKHIGLLTMKDRAELIGAYLEIDSHPGEGTSLKFRFSPALQQLTPAAMKER